MQGIRCPIAHRCYYHCTEILEKSKSLNKKYGKNREGDYLEIYTCIYAQAGVKYTDGQRRLSVCASYC